MAALTAGCIDIETQMANAVKRYVVEGARVLTPEAETVDAVGRAQKEWESTHDDEVKRLRGELSVTPDEDRAVAVKGIGKATTVELHTVDEAVHEARMEEQEFRKAHCKIVQDLKVREVRSQHETEISHRLVALETKVRQEVRATSLRMLNNVLGEASLSELEALKVMDRLIYNSETRLGDALAVGSVCSYPVGGPTGAASGTIEVVGARATSGPTVVNDVDMVIVEEPPLALWHPIRLKTVWRWAGRRSWLCSNAHLAWWHPI